MGKGRKLLPFPRYITEEYVVIISGLQKLTLLDFPGRTACTVFFSGCNFRCPFCHNASLVHGSGDQIELEDFFTFLRGRKGILDGVAVTGGEPLLQPQLPVFLERIGEMGFQVKLDTNGSFFDRLQEVVAAGLVDYVAMDIKSSREGYAQAAGCKADMDSICKSVAYLLEGHVEYEFRTTAAKGIVNPQDFPRIAKWIQGAKRYFIQGFVDSGDLLGTGASAYSKEEMEALRKSVLPYVPSAALRGV